MKKFELIQENEKAHKAVRELILSTPEEQKEAGLAAIKLVEAGKVEEAFEGWAAYFLPWRYVDSKLTCTLIEDETDEEVWKIMAGHYIYRASKMFSYGSTVSEDDFVLLALSKLLHTSGQWETTHRADTPFLDDLVKNTPFEAFEQHSTNMLCTYAASFLGKDFSVKYSNNLESVDLLLGNNVISTCSSGFYKECLMVDKSFVVFARLLIVFKFLNEGKSKKFDSIIERINTVLGFDVVTGEVPHA